MDRPCYKLRPIGSAQVLARVLGCDEALLIKLAANASKYYRVAHELKKEDGSIRIVFSVQNPLKIVQKRIKKRLLDKVFYPAYLQGGIRDLDNPRDYVRNAEIHAGSIALINEDISNFFPSISREVIFDIWMRCFNFPHVVAEILTSLTVKDGGLAQGASTSCHLANLSFWDFEPGLVAKLTAKGFRFTRFVDDITVSSINQMNAEVKGEIVSLIRRMASRKGLRLKARKHRIYASSERMLVNNLVVNKKPSIQVEERSRIRAAVRECEMRAREGITNPEFRSLLNSVRGRVKHLERLHPKEAKSLLLRLTRLSESNS